MNLTPDECAIFVNRGWQEGLAMVCERRAALAAKVFREVDPLDSVRIAKAQAAVTIYEKDIPSIARDVNEFLRQGETSKAVDA